MATTLRFPLPVRFFLIVLAVWSQLSTCLSGSPIIPTYTPRIWRKGTGLPGNEITGVCQDKAGYLWITTTAGMARFDGTRFIAFEPEPHDFRSPPGYITILADTDDSLLLAPNAGGLLRFKDGRFSRHSLPATYDNSIVTNMARSADGALWICIRGGVAIRQHAEREQIFDLGAGSNAAGTTQVVHDGSGRIWLSNGSVLARFENGTLVKVPVRNEKESLFIASSRKDGPWVFSDERLFKFSGDDPVFVAKTNSYTSAHYIQSVWEDANGDLWMGTRFRGLRRLTPGGETLHVVENPGDVSAVIVDTSGNVWAGSNGGGLIRIKPGMLRRYNKEDGLIENHSLTVCQDNNGTMWFSNRDGGIVYLNKAGQVTLLEKPKKWENFSAFSVSPTATDGVWATSSHGLLLANQTKLEQRPEMDSGMIIRVSFTARDGSLWLALGPGKLGHLRENEWSVFGSEHGLEESEIRSIAEDSEGRIWVGCNNSSFFRFENSIFTRVALPTSTPIGAVQAIHFDTEGSCWVGTERGGLIHLNDAGAHIININCGLPYNNISQIVSDDNNTIWFGSPDAIYHVQRTELLGFIDGAFPRIYPVSIGADEGISEITCLSLYQPSAWKSIDGLLWFTTREGVVAVNPAREKLSLTPLIVQTNAVHYEGNPHQFVRNVVIDSSVRELKFKYSVLCLSTPGRVRARYKLQGYDDDWTATNASGVARYTRLPPGEYTFMVTALIAGMPGSEASDLISVTVQASWWQTAWFRLAVFSIITSLIALAVRVWSHRRLRAKLARLEHDSALERERARIAKNIHDDLGSGLTRISLLTQSSKNGGDPEQLDKIYNTVTELTQSMDEIVWAVNPKNDDLENLAIYLSDFAQNFLVDAGIRCRVLLPDLLPQCTVPAQHRHHLFMGCKEALNNIAKHAQATEVTMQLFHQADQVTIVITDNGRGLQRESLSRTPSRTKTGNGLANMQSRMASLGGSCEIGAPPIGGTTVTFKFTLRTQTSL